jgi:hypothetical protein
LEVAEEDQHCPSLIKNLSDMPFKFVNRETIVSDAPVSQKYFLKIEKL